MLGQLAHDQRRDPRLDRLVARAGDAVIANLWVGHDDHLAAIRRVGDDFLVASDARVEHDFGGDVGLSTERLADIDGAVFEGKGSLAEKAHRWSGVS